MATGQEIIVDENDNPIGSKNWQDQSYDDIYRCSALWLTDINTGDILIAQRKWTKKNDPGKWAAAVAGTNEDGETYESNMIKETEEEIGLTNLRLDKGPKVLIDDGLHKFFCQWYFAEVDKKEVQIKIQEDEIEAVKWIALPALIEDLQTNSNRYVPSMPHTLELFSDRER
jgi:isopentenyldiphosphate isomerase